MNYVLKYALKTVKTMGSESVSASKSTIKMNLDNAFSDKNARKTVQGMQQVIVCVTLASSKMSSMTDKSTVSDALKAPIGMHKGLNARSYVQRMPNSTLLQGNVSASRVMQSLKKFVKSAQPIFSSPITTVFCALSSLKLSTIAVSASRDIPSTIWGSVHRSARKSINSSTLSQSSVHAIQVLDIRVMLVLCVRMGSTQQLDNVDKDVGPIKCYLMEYVCVWVGLDLTLIKDVLIVWHWMVESKSMDSVPCALMDL